MRSSVTFWNSAGRIVSPSDTTSATTPSRSMDFAAKVSAMPKRCWCTQTGTQTWPVNRCGPDSPASWAPPGAVAGESSGPGSSAAYGRLRRIASAAASSRGIRDSRE